MELANKHGKCLEEGTVMFRDKEDDSHSIVIVNLLYQSQLNFPNFVIVAWRSFLTKCTCNFCSSQLYQSIAGSSAAGKFDAYLCSLLSAGS